jgi:ribosomal protein S18 acetylase RimI-like enzyme
MATEFRRATLDDAEVVARYAADMALETESLKLDRERVRRGVEAALRDEAKGFYLLAVSDGAVVGQLMVTYEWSDWSNGMRWWLQSVYVHPEFQSRGIFSGLFERVRELAAADGGVCAVRLYVEHNNQRAQAVYRKLGFEETHYRLYEIELPRSG